MYDGTSRAVHSARCFTGKERDAESGNDYMFARYYNSATGRFLSPDWSVKIDPVPYAKLGNPQSLNLYSYVLNNPLSNVDPDGHETEAEKEAKIAAAARAQKGSDAYDVKKTNISNMQIFKSGSDKCNEFVSDTVKSADGTRPVVEGTGKIATAAQLADPSVKITGLTAPDSMSNAKAGDVIAQIHGTEPNGNVDAHAGIIVALPTADSPGQTASANANQGGQITVNDWGFRNANATPNNGERNGSASPAPVVRHPLGDPQ
jgi:RHS repeat-associated protein